MKEDPAARPSGRRVPRSAKNARFGLAGRTDPASERTKISDEINGRTRVSTSLDSIKDLRIDRGHFKHSIEEICQKSAQNSVRRATIRRGRHRACPAILLIDCIVSHHSSHLVSLGKPRVRPEPRPYRGVSSRVIREERS